MTPPNLSILLVMVCFWVTLWLVGRFLVRPVTEVLDERDGRIDGAQREWTRQNEEMETASRRIEEELLEAARESARRRETLRAGAMDEKQRLLDEARTEAESRLEQALESLDRDVEAARKELGTRAEVLAREFAARLIGRGVAS